jgi:transcription factor S
MKLKFCPKCKTLLIPKKISDKFFLKCGNCDFIRELKKKEFLVTHEKIKSKEFVGKGIKKNENIFATYKHKCKKCGYDKAQILDLGIFYSDEDNLIMLKCGKCGFSERIGRKTS